MADLFVFTALRCLGGDARGGAVWGWLRANSFFGDMR